MNKEPRDTTEYQIMEGIALLLGCQPYRLRYHGEIWSGPYWELQATYRNWEDVYIRIQGSYLEFYINEYRRAGTQGPAFLTRLELANPQNLTRANLRTTIRETKRLYHGSRMESQC